MVDQSGIWRARSLFAKLIVLKLKTVEIQDAAEENRVGTWCRLPERGYHISRLAHQGSCASSDAVFSPFRTYSLGALEKRWNFVLTNCLWQLPTVSRIFRKMESFAKLLATKNCNECFRFGWFGCLMFLGWSYKLVTNACNNWFLFSEVIKIKIVTLLLISYHIDHSISTFCWM